MNDTLINLADALNWIDKLQGAAFALRHRGAVRLEVDSRTDRSGREIEAILKRYHIPIGGRRVTAGKDGKIMFLIGHKQAAWAEYLLERAGLPVVSTPVDPRNAAWAAAHDSMPPPWDADLEPGPPPSPSAYPIPSVAASRLRAWLW